MRLIDADALLKALNDYGLSYRADINGMIMQAPTIAPSGDLISRAEAIVALMEQYYWDEKDYDTAIETINELPSAETHEIRTETHGVCSDLISRADAIGAVDSIKSTDNWQGAVIALLSALPSADAEPTVIRAKTFMRKEDFDKWAEDIKKQNKSIVCIPCDAEVVSADSVVRCKDCRRIDEIGWCEFIGGYVHDGYCAWGERREP